MTNAEVITLLKKNPIAVGCGVLSLALAVGIYFRGGAVPAAEEELAQKTDEGTRLAANLQNAAQLKEQVDTLAACGKEIDARLVHASQTLTNYQYFYKLESETGAKMTVIAQAPVGGPSKGAAKSLFVGVPFSITVQGTMTQMIDYLRRLESGARYGRVMSVSFGVPSNDRGGIVTLALNLELLGQP
jgi:hypothetical protein